MPSLIDYRRRIRSVKNTQQITKAMKMVSAAKLRRAQEAVIAARPFADSVRELLANVTNATKGTESATENPLVVVRPEKKVLVIVMNADRGLAGAFSTNINKAAQKFINESMAGKDCEIEAIGKKARDYFRRRGYKIAGETMNLTKAPKYADAVALAKKIMDRYASAEVDAVYLVNNDFKSVLAATLNIKQLLPVPVPPDQPGVDYIFDQPVEEVLARLYPRYVEVSIFRAILESAAAEHAARMTAMDAASSNAADVIERLTLYMNRVRQASITREIIEVVSGASALE